MGNESAIEVKTEFFFLDDFGSYWDCFYAWKNKSHGYHYYSKSTLNFEPIKAECKVIILDVSWLSDEIIVHQAPWDNNRWAVTHVPTGSRIAGAATCDQAIQLATDNLNASGEEKANKIWSELKTVQHHLGAGIQLEK